MRYHNSDINQGILALPFIISKIWYIFKSLIKLIPGHTRSWGNSRPGILTECYKNSQPDGSLGPMNPISQSTYDFIQELFAELNKVFPDDFLHLGGDEVPFDCWLVLGKHARLKRHGWAVTSPAKNLKLVLKIIS